MDSLPTLPVPPLEQTIQQFLRSAKPFLNDNEFETTKKVAQDFAAPGGDGEKLQQLVENKASSSENWLSEWWLNWAYLDVRLPLPVHCNTSIVFPHQSFSSLEGQLSHAAAIIAGSLDFKAIMDEKRLQPEKLGPFTLDMSQFDKILGVCRIPGLTRDTLRMPDPAAPARHIVVAHNNHFFCVPVYGEGGEVLNQSQLVAQLRAVVAASPQPALTPVGILTTEERTTWCKARDALIQADDGQNKASLDMIESSLFMVCLDARSPINTEQISADDQMNTDALNIMHGGGSNGNAANRWFDKTSQFIVGPRGEVGLSYEHSPGDSHPIVTDHLHTYCSEKSGSADPVLPAGKFGAPRLLPFTVPPTVEQAIRKAHINIQKLADDADIHCFVFDGYGKDFIRLLQLGSPDSYIQMAIQFAFYRLYETPGAQYESATTRRFKYGRTETIRSCSSEAIKFAQTMLNASTTSEQKFAALKNAMQAHKEYIINAISGQGIDRHMLGLRMAATEMGMELPNIFMDPGFTRSCHMRLSTSQVPAMNTTCGLYGPLVSDGYSCCYNPRPEQIVFGTAAFKSCTETNALKFCRSLVKSLEDMKYALSQYLDSRKL